MMVCFNGLLLLLFCVTSTVNGYYKCWENDPLNTSRPANKSFWKNGSSCFYAFKGDPLKPDNVLYGISGKPHFGLMLCRSKWEGHKSSGTIKNYHCGIVPDEVFKFPRDMIGMTYCCCWKYGEGKEGYFCNDPAKVKETWPKWIHGPTTTPHTIPPTTTHIPTGVKSCLKGTAAAEGCKIRHDGNFPKHCFNQFDNRTLVQAGCDQENYCAKIKTNKCGIGKDKNGRLLCCCNYENCNIPAFKPKFPKRTGLESCLEGGRPRQCPLVPWWAINKNYPKNCYNIFNGKDLLVQSGCDINHYCDLPRQVPNKGCYTEIYLRPYEVRTYCCCKDFINCNVLSLKPNVTWTGVKSCLNDSNNQYQCTVKKVSRKDQGNLSYPMNIYTNNCYKEFDKIRGSLKIVAAGCDEENDCGKNHIKEGKCGPGNKGKILCCCGQYENCNDMTLKPNIHPKGMNSCLEENKVRQCSLQHGNYPQNCYNEFNKDDYNKEIVSAGCDKMGYCDKYHIPEGKCAQRKDEYGKMMIFCCCNQYDNCNDASFKPKTPTPTGMKSCLEDSKVHECRLINGNYPKSCYNEFSKLDYNKRILSAGCDKEDHCGRNHITEGKCGPGKTRPDEGKIFCCCNHFENCNKPAFKPKIPTPTGMKSCLKGNEPRQCTLNKGNYAKNCYNEFNNDTYNKMMIWAGCDIEDYCAINHITEGKCGIGKDKVGKVKIFCCCSQYENCNYPSLEPKSPAPNGMQSCLEVYKERQCPMNKGNYAKNCYNEFNNDTYNKELISAGCDIEDYCGKNHIPTNKCGPGKEKSKNGKIFCCCDQFDNCNKPTFKPKIPTPTGVRSCLEGNEVRQCLLHAGNYPKNCYNEFNKDDYNKEIVSAGCDKMGYCSKYHIPEGKCAQEKDEDGKMMIFCCCNQYDNCNDASFKPKTPTPTGMKSCLEDTEVRKCTLNKGNYPKNCYNEFNNDTYNKELISAGCDTEDYCSRNDIAEGKCGSGKVKPDKGKIFCCCNQFDDCNKPTLKPNISTPNGMSSCLEGTVVRKCILKNGNYPNNCYNEFNDDAYERELISAGCDKDDFCGRNHIAKNKCGPGIVKEDKGKIFCCCDQFVNCNIGSFVPIHTNGTGVKSCLEDNKERECNLVNQTNYPNNCYNEFNKVSNTIVSSGCDQENYCGRNDVPERKCGPGKIPQDEGKIFCCCDEYSDCNLNSFTPQHPYIPPFPTTPSSMKRAMMNLLMKKPKSSAMVMRMGLSVIMLCILLALM